MTNEQVAREVLRGCGSPEDQVNAVAVALDKRDEQWASRVKVLEDALRFYAGPWGGHVARNHGFTDYMTQRFQDMLYKLGETARAALGSKEKT